MRGARFGGGRLQSLGSIRFSVCRCAVRRARRTAQRQTIRRKVPLQKQNSISWRLLPGKQSASHCCILIKINLDHRDLSLGLIAPEWVIRDRDILLEIGQGGAQVAMEALE